MGSHETTPGMKAHAEEQRKLSQWGTEAMQARAASGSAGPMSEAVRRHLMQATPKAEAPAAQHTPGPWIAHALMVSEAGQPIGNGRDICHCGLGMRPSRDLEQSRANARLIAAAPRLLAALQALLHECTQDGVSERIDRAISEEAYAACEQAEGAGS